MTNVTLEDFQKQQLEFIALAAQFASLDAHYAAQGKPLPAPVRVQLYRAQDALAEFRDEFDRAARESLNSRIGEHNAMVSRFIAEQNRLKAAGRSTADLDALAEAELEPRVQRLRREKSAYYRELVHGQPRTT